MVFNYITTGPDRNVVLVYGIKLRRKGLSRRSHGRAAACDFEAGVRPAWTMERAGEDARPVSREFRHCDRVYGRIAKYPVRLGRACVRVSGRSIEA
jgi:hypothetical protein